MRHEQIPLERKKSPCDGPQCRGQERPMTPVNTTPVSMQDPIVMVVRSCDSHEIDFDTVPLEDISFLSDPHIWRSDPPPRA
jgi:hypothetical protein